MKCRFCKEEIDTKATKCPRCQADLRNWFVKHPILSVILVLAVLGMFGSKKSSAPKPVAEVVGDTQTTQASATPAAQTTFKVAETIKMTDYQLTINTVKKAAQKGYSTPKKGNEYVLVNLTIQNTSDKEVSYNPYDFKLQDSNGNQTTSSYVSLDDQLDSGSLAANGKVVGSISFEAPKGDLGLKLIYQPNMFLDNQRITVELQ
jgi:hypothetical protein